MTEFKPRASVLIASPLYTGETCAQFTWSLLGSQVKCLKHGILLDFDWISASLIDVARDDLVDRFLRREELTHLMFVDGDLGWSPDAIGRMVLREADVIGGVYPYKADKEGYPYQAAAGPHVDRVREVRRLPGGFLLLSRKAVEALAAGADRYRVIDGDKEHTVARVFDIPIIEGSIVSEDYRLCDKLRELGFRIWCEMDINFTHRGPRTWQGNLFAHESRSVVPSPHDRAEVKADLDNTRLTAGETAHE